MDLLTHRRAAAALWCALAACAPKPLRIVGDDADVATDAADVTDAEVTDAGVTDADVTDATSPADVAVADGAVSRDGGAVVPTSCAAAPSRADCATVLVRPETTFCVGVPLTATNAAWSASPPVCGLSLSPFRVDADEVTVARFRVFYDRWVARTLPGTVDARFENGAVFHAQLPPRMALSEWNPTNTGCTWTESPMGAREQQPINCLSWATAMYFCAWEGGHLPTATQYEYLARWHGDTGGAGRTFPWGDARPTCQLAQYGSCEGDDGLRTRRVGSIAAGAVAGVFDLAGNVADMVADDYAPYPLLAASECWTRALRDPLCLPSYAGIHFARGSSWMNPAEVVMYSYFRPTGAMMDTSPARGFRCAYAAP